MGSDLYVSVQYKSEFNETWWPITYKTAALVRGPVVDFFGDCDPDSSISKADGYLSYAEWRTCQDHPECPWRRSEPYWVRLISGEEFVRTVREEPWRIEWPDADCGPHLRAMAAMIESYTKDGTQVRVWCWHSQ
jgi:hypothetical protein